MVDPADILEFVDAVADKFRPQEIVRFGSYAYGITTADSDVDLLVITNYRGASVDKVVKIRTAVPRTFPMDLLVRSKSEIRRRISWNDFFLKEITEKGLVLYDADDRRVGAQGLRRFRRRFATAAVA
ncbi:MAG: Nucleotidyltransferase domain protein [Phycisphaerales bacterium]|nr:Nucleotidyltransferase domain protein [Phycisphaerales bacterium]